jgi:hypothetical protein
MEILRKDHSCVKLKDFLIQCPSYECLKHPAQSLDFDNLYQTTLQCFKKINSQVLKSSQRSQRSHSSQQSQRGGGNQDLVGPGPQPSGDLYDGTPISNVKDLYINIRNYMKMHKIIQLTSDTLIPYGIILSTLNLPKDLQILGRLYPDLIDYLVENELVDKLTFETLIPIGNIINDMDMHNINHLKLDSVN